MTSVEFVKNMYTPKFAGSEALGHVASLVRNAGVDMINVCDLAKHNLVNYASGIYTHPLKYE